MNHTETQNVQILISIVFLPLEMIQFHIYIIYIYTHIPMDSSSLVSAQFSCIPWSPKINAAFGFRREKPISSFPGFADEQFRFGILAVCCWVGGCWETLDTPSYDLYIPLYHDVVQQKMGNNIFHFPNVMISYTISTSHKNLPKVIHVVFRQKTVPALRMPSSPKTWFIESYVPPLLAMSCWWKRSCPRTFDVIRTIMALTR